MHKAGKFIFRITNGSAFFVLEKLTLNANVLYGLVTEQDETNNTCHVSGHVHTAAKRVLIQIVPPIFM